MTWTTLTYSFGSVLTSAKMGQLYDNFASFAAKEVNAPVLASGYVTTAMITDSNVTAAKIADANVTNAKLANDSVGGANIIAGAVIHSKITFTLGAEGTVAANALFPIGLHMCTNVSGASTIEVSPDGGSTWRVSAGNFYVGAIFSDGISVRHASSSTGTLYRMRLA